MTDDMPRAVRDLVRGLDRAALATALPVQSGAWPYASLVLVAVDHDLSPILLLSDLAEHTKAIAADGRVSLLFDGTQGLEQPLTGPRVTLVGRAGAHRRRAPGPPLSRPASGCRDVCRLQGLQFLPGGRGARPSGGRLRQDSLAECRANSRGLLLAGLAESEDGIVRHMNEDHADAVQLYAGKLLGLAGSDWRMTGIDAEGIDLRQGGQVARLAFDAPLGAASEARKVLVALVAKARAG